MTGVRIGFLILNDTVSPWSSKDLWRYCVIEFISYFEPLKDTIGRVKYQF